MRRIINYCRALYVEWATLRSSYVLPLFGWIVTVIVASAQLSLYEEAARSSDFQRLWVPTYAMVQIFPILIGGSWALMGENAGRWRIDRLICARPICAFLMRAAAGAISGALWAVVAVGTVAVALPFVGGHSRWGQDTPGNIPLELWVGSAYHGAAVALLTFSFAYLLGRAPAAIGSVIAIFILISPLLASLGEWARYLPGTSGLAVVGAVGPQYFPPATGALVLGLWALLPAALACAVSTGRMSR